MAERSIRADSRPRPGPRPQHRQRHRTEPHPHYSARRSTHGTAKRRTHQEPPADAAPQLDFSEVLDEQNLRSALNESEPRQRIGRERPARPERLPIDKARNRRWWFAVAFLAIAAGVFALFEAPTFEAASTQISGHGRTNEGAIAAALAIGEDQALITYDTQAAVERLSALPWVEQASVIRQWPSTVRVVIHEHALVAGVGDAGGQQWLLLSSDRQVIEERLSPPAGVPLIVVADQTLDSAVVGEPMEGIARGYELALGRPEQLGPWISNWSIDDAGVVTANLTGSARAIFGAAGDIRTQLVSLASILNGGTPLTCIDLIDLSTPDTPVIQRNQSCLAVSVERG